MGGRLRSLRFSVVVLLILGGLPAPVEAQQFICRPIAAGDTASSLARRLTGKADAAYGHAFQIRDPARRMFVPKSQYGRLRSGWQACVARRPAAKTPVAQAPAVELAAWAVRDEPPIATSPQALASAPLSLARADRTLTDLPFAGPIGAGLLLMMVVVAVAGSLTLRPMSPAVRRAGENFVTVFERPLVDASSGIPPIQARLRFLRRKQELEIFIAPGPGHRYPNLADHKKNVEYDVNRVIRVLGNCVLSRPLRADGRWVVVTISERAEGSAAKFPGVVR